MENMSPKIQKIKSLEKALNLLELLSDSNELRITEISKNLNIGITTVYRMLSTLKYHGYVIQNKKTLKYHLGYKLFILGNRVQNTFDLLNIVIPFLQSLSKKTNEGINFSILEGRETVCLSKIESPEILRTDIKIGTKIPAHCTAVGKAILAFLPEEKLMMLYGNENDRLDTPTINSISSVMKLKECLKKIRKNGYAIDKEEYQIGIHCLGVPILNAKGISIAGISVTGPSSRFDLSNINKLKNTLMIISKDISDQLNR
jgi:DNA-binding IclR family transcriptional regulator